MLQTKGCHDCYQPPEAYKRLEGFFCTAVRGSVALPILWFPTFHFQNSEKFSIVLSYVISDSLLLKLIQNLRDLQIKWCSQGLINFLLQQEAKTEQKYCDFGDDWSKFQKAESKDVMSRCVLPDIRDTDHSVLKEVLKVTKIHIILSKNMKGKA